MKTVILVWVALITAPLVFYFAPVILIAVAALAGFSGLCALIAWAYSAGSDLFG